MGARVESMAGLPRQAGIKIADIPARLATLDSRYQRKFADIQFQRQFQVEEIQPREGRDPLSFSDQLLSLKHEQRLLRAIKESGEKVEAEMGQELEFADLPPLLDGYILDKAEGMGMNLLAVPRFPIRTQQELEAVATGEVESPIRSIYGKAYLTSVMRGEAPIFDQEGSYVLMDSRKGGLLEKLKERAAGDVNELSLEDINKLIMTKGEDVLLGMGFRPQSRARIVIATAEHLLLQRATQYDGRFGEVVSSTTVRGTRDHLIVTANDNDINAVNVNDVADSEISPRLAIIFDKPKQNTYLKPTNN